MSYMMTTFLDVPVDSDLPEPAPLEGKPGRALTDRQKELELLQMLDV